MKSIILLFIFIGVLLVIWNRSNRNCPPNRVEYRYIPKSFLDEQYSRLPLMSLYGSLFQGSDAWIKSGGTQNNFDEHKREVYN